MPDWIAYDGSGMPVGPQVKVKVEYNNGVVGKWLAAKFLPWDWRTDAPGYNVRRYLIHPHAKP